MERRRIAKPLRGATVLAYGSRATRYKKPFGKTGELAIDGHPYSDVRPGIATAESVFLFYDPLHEIDCRHTAIYSGDSVTRLECNHLGHHVANELANMALLQPILDKMVEGSFTRQDFYALYRNRLSSATYVHKMMTAAIKKGHYALALQVVLIMADRLEPGRKRWRFRRHRKGLKLAIATGGCYEMR